MCEYVDGVGKLTGKDREGIFCISMKDLDFLVIKTQDLYRSEVAKELGISVELGWSACQGFLTSWFIFNRSLCSQTYFGCFTSWIQKVGPRVLNTPSPRACCLATIQGSVNFNHDFILWRDWQPASKRVPRGSLSTSYDIKSTITLVLGSVVLEEAIPEGDAS